MQRLAVKSIADIEKLIQENLGDDSTAYYSGISKASILLIPYIPCFMIFHDPKHGWICGSYTDSYNDDESGYWDENGVVDGYLSSMVIAPTFDIAICCAALKTKGIEVVPNPGWNEVLRQK